MLDFQMLNQDTIQVGRAQRAFSCEFWAALCVLGAALLGCKNAGARPDASTPDAEIGDGGGDRIEIGPDGGDALTTVTVTPDTAGTLESADSKLVLEIPAGAVTSPVEISVRALSAEEVTARIAETLPSGLAYELGPDGLTFAQDITVRLDLTMEDLGDVSTGFPVIRLATHASDGTVEILDSVESTVVHNDLGEPTGLEASGKLSHFSPLFGYPEDYSLRVLPSSKLTRTIGDVVRVEALVTNTGVAQGLPFDIAAVGSGSVSLVESDAHRVGFGGLAPLGEASLTRSFRCETAGPGAALFLVYVYDVGVGNDPESSASQSVDIDCEVMSSSGVVDWRTLPSGAITPGAEVLLDLFVAPDGAVLVDDAFKFVFHPDTNLAYGQEGGVVTSSGPYGYLVFLPVGSRTFTDLTVTVTHGCSNAGCVSVLGYRPLDETPSEEAFSSAGTGGTEELTVSCGASNPCNQLAVYGFGEFSLENFPRLTLTPLPPG